MRRARPTLIATLALAAGAGCSAVPAHNPARTSSPVQAEAPAPEFAGVSAADFERFVAGWAGHYDNLRQREAQLATGVPEAERNPSLELHIVPIDLPAFGPRAFYAEWVAPGTSTTPVRQRIYAFERDATTGTVTLRLHIFPNDAAFVARTAGAWRDAARLRGLTPADMAPLRGCDLRFRAVGGAIPGEAFAGEMEKRSCCFPSFESPSREIYSWSQMTKTDWVYSYQDGWFNLDDSVYRRFATHWFVFEKR